jgi:hypothetical protein
MMKQRINMTFKNISLINKILYLFRSFPAILLLWFTTGCYFHGKEAFAAYENYKFDPKVIEKLKPILSSFFPWAVFHHGSIPACCHHTLS